MKKWVLLFVLLLAGCAGLPPSVTPVEGFQLERYLGKWYEIARLDHSFERAFRFQPSTACGLTAACGW